MIRATVQSKFLDISKSIKVVYLIAAGVFLTMLSFIVYQNIIVTTTIAACSLAAYIVLSQPIKNYSLQISEAGIQLDQETIPLENVIAFAIVDLGRVIEFVIKTTSLTQDFYYFYIDEQDPAFPFILREMTQFVPYEEEIVNENRVHIILRAIGMK